MYLLIILYYLNAALLYSLHSFSCVASPVSVGSASTIYVRSLQVRFPGLAHSFISCQLQVKG